MSQERLDAMCKALTDRASEEEIKELLAKNPEEAVAWFTAKGYDFTEDDVKAFAGKINELIEKKNNGELSEDDLDAVAGGISAGGWMFIGALAVVAVACCPW